MRYFSLSAEEEKSAFALWIYVLCIQKMQTNTRTDGQTDGGSRYYVRKQHVRDRNLYLLLSRSGGNIK